MAARVTTVILTILLQSTFIPQARAQSLSEVLDGVSRSVKEFEDQLPDFVCKEKVTSTQIESGEVVKEKVVESLFTGIQRSAKENTGHFAFQESREVVAINGKPVRQGTPFPKLPYQFAGGYSSLLVTTFAPESLEIHNYTIADHYKTESTDALLVRFATREDQKKLHGEFQGVQLIAKDVGSAWIDRKTFRVQRLQRQSLNLPAFFTRSMATVDFGPVAIGGSEFWMPKKIQADVSERNAQIRVSYIAEYTDCKKFMTDIILR